MKYLILLTLLSFTSCSVYLDSRKSEDGNTYEIGTCQFSDRPIIQRDYEAFR